MINSAMSDRPWTILVVEDDPLYRQLIGFTLKRAGYAVELAGDGEEAWQRWLAGGIDLIITDEQMPRCDGSELLDRIRRHAGAIENSADCPSSIFAIVCTAKVWEMERCIKFPGDQVLAVLPKPFSPRQLQKRLVQHFADIESARRGGLTCC